MGVAVVVGSEKPLAARFGALLVGSERGLYRLTVWAGSGWAIARTEWGRQRLTRGAGRQGVPNRGRTL